jgi:cytochrome bd-type quinol oxidase subunit 2
VVAGKGSTKRDQPILDYETRVYPKRDWVSFLRVPAFICMALSVLAMTRIGLLWLGIGSRYVLANDRRAELDDTFISAIFWLVVFVAAVRVLLHGWRKRDRD